MDNGKIIEILDPQAGRLRETAFGSQASFEYNPIDVLRNKILMTKASSGHMMDFREAFVLTPDAANMLRDGIRLLSFTEYQNRTRTFAPFIRTEQSSRPQEEYLRDAALGALPKIPSGTEAPTIVSGFEGGKTIVNTRYAGLVEITGDDLRFDRIGKIKQIAPELGISGAMTEEQAVYAVLTTTGNFVRNSTTNDNDVGANTANTTFSAAGIETGLSTIQTSKDRKSRAYLGLMADTLICGPRLAYAATQLLMNPEVQRVGGNTTNDVYGTGTGNPFRGIIKRIIVSPWFSASYSWLLMDSTRLSVMFQVVQPFNILQEAQDGSSESWLTREVTRYQVSGYFGTDIVDDRPLFFSSSATAPTVA